MLHDLDFKFVSKSLQKNKGGFRCFRFNVAPAPAVLPTFQPLPLSQGFSTNIVTKGHYLYEMLIQDPSHYLGCALRLKVEDYYGKNGVASKIVVCYFPQIDDEALKKFIERDSTLYEMIITQFHMRILRVLLLFCIDHYAFQIVIYMADKQEKKISIYTAFLSHYAQPLTVNRWNSEILIPVTPETLTQWIHFMERTSQGFRQILRREQCFNYVIRSYLKRDPCLRFFCGI